MKLLVLNGPNLNMLGIREPDIYGRTTYADLVRYIEDVCAREGIEIKAVRAEAKGFWGRLLLALGFTNLGAERVICRLARRRP